MLPLTSAGVQQLGPLDEAQVARPGPQRVRLPEAEPGVEVVRLQALLTVDGIVAAGAVRAAHPDLSKRQTNTCCLCDCLEDLACFVSSSPAGRLELGAAHLPEMRVSQGTSGFWVDDDDPDSRKDLAQRQHRGFKTRWEERPHVKAL